MPDYYEPRATRYWEDEDGQKWRSFGNMCWFTNLDISKRHEDLILYKTYSPDEYPKYDNYDAIEVGRRRRHSGRLRRCDGRADHLPGQVQPRPVRDRWHRHRELGVEAGSSTVYVTDASSEYRTLRCRRQDGAVDGDLYFVIDGVVEVPYRASSSAARQQT